MPSARQDVHHAELAGAGYRFLWDSLSGMCLQVPSKPKDACCETFIGSLTLLNFLLFLFLSLFFSAPSLGLQCHVKKSALSTQEGGWTTINIFFIIYTLTTLSEAESLSRKAVILGNWTLFEFFSLLLLHCFHYELHFGPQITYVNIFQLTNHWTAGDTKKNVNKTPSRHTQTSFLEFSLTL